jgi:ATP-dependent RNA circularization protein (DNA/RNA ligase family)
MASSNKDPKMMQFLLDKAFHDLGKDAFLELISKRNFAGNTFLHSAAQKSSVQERCNRNILDIIFTKAKKVGGNEALKKLINIRNENDRNVVEYLKFIQRKGIGIGAPNDQPAIAILEELLQTLLQIHLIEIQV